MSPWESLTGIASKCTPSSCNTHRQRADRVRGVEYSFMDKLANLTAQGWKVNGIGAPRQFGAAMAVPSVLPAPEDETGVHPAEAEAVG